MAAKRVGGGAEAVLNLNPGSSIVIRYHDQFGPHDNLLLLEVDEEFMEEVLQNRVTIRGQTDDDALICSRSATYSMKFVGTSNSMFLIPPVDHSSSPEPEASAIKLALGHIELIRTAPKLDKLKLLLHQNPYSINEAELELEDMLRPLYGWEDLLDLVQASEEELKAGLKSLSAVEIDGCWRVVEDRAMDEILNMILGNSVLHDWSLHSLSEVDVLSVLEEDGFDCGLVLHCLETYGSKTVGETGCIWEMDERRVCLRFSRRTLSSGKMKLESFMETWRRSIPSGMNANLDMLKGEVLYDTIGFETWIRPFRVSDLPSTPAERFAALFSERQRWEWRDLEPYIRDLKVPGLSAEGLLLKYTRRTQPSADVEPIFSARS